MSHIKEMHPAGVVVILIILALFALSIAMLCWVVLRYRHLNHMIGEDAEENDFLNYTLREFSAAYKKFGQDTNTPGIIADCVGVKLPVLLFAERFLNNAVSIFVTLGLFGTFLGLSMSVTALTQLISYSNTSEWLSVLDSVGGGLMSALSGMGVAFYTSLVGAGCSILLTALRTVFSPQTQREKLTTALELWLDHDVAPTLATERAKDDEQLIRQMIGAMNTAAASMEKTLKTATGDMSRAMQTGAVEMYKALQSGSGDMSTTLKGGSEEVRKALQSGSGDLQKLMEGSRPYLVAFHQTVEKFNNGVHDFTEVDYNLRGTVERLDLTVRELTRALRQASPPAPDKESER